MLDRFPLATHLFNVFHIVVAFRRSSIGIVSYLKVVMTFRIQTWNVENDVLYFGKMSFSLRIVRHKLIT